MAEGITQNKIYSIRGAVTAEANTPEAVNAAAVALIKEIEARNNIPAGGDGVINIMISSTADITAAYPAKAVREYGYEAVPLFSCMEPDITGSLPMCIRMMVTVCGSGMAKHVYLGGAKGLRPDLQGNEK